MKREILSIITALALCLSLCPTWALAAEADPSLCKHHPEHTEDCGYTAPTEGHPCGHEHTEDCYTTDEAGGEVLDCHHSHDSECGYVQADPGTSCGYVCRICPIEDLIAALPDTVTEDNAADVRAQLDHILDLYRELDEDEQEEINLSRVIDLQGALDAANAPMAVAGEININSTRTNILTAEAGGCPGHTFTGTTAMEARIYVESGVHNVTFSSLNITSAKVGIAPGATMNLTIEGANTIKSSEAGIYVPVGATLVINGNGSLNVSGGVGGAGIGGATYAPDETGSDGDPNCGTVEINGGAITATGGNCAAGIGGGIGTEGNPGNGGTVTINGGTVTATGGSDNYYGGAGIGGSGGVLNEWNELLSGSGGTLTINRGHVTLAPGQYDSTNSTAYGFGRGSSDPNTSAGTCELTLADASYLDSGTTLDPKGKYTINGDPTEDMIVVPEDLIYSGKAQELDGKIYIDDSKTGSAEHFGRTFTVNASKDGWNYTISPAEVKEAGNYTVTFSKEGHTSISKTFTVAKSGTDLADGKVKTYNGSEETTSFTASDTITVKATPTPTGEAPTNSAMFAASFTPPTTGQMAVFVSDTQVSAPVGVGADGTYTMEVSAADVLLAAGGPGTGITLTAKFVENNNMADGTGTATVNITAAAKAERDGTLLGYYGESGLVAALANSGNEGAVFTLLDNMERETDLKINISCTLDLNGKTIRSKGEYVPTLSTYYGTAVTIRGEGTVISEQGYGFSVGGTTTLEGGTFISGAANCGGVYVQAGKLIVTGEAVVIENTGGGTGLGVGYNAEAQLSGGTYSSIWVDSPHTLAGLLNQEGASRVAYYKDNATLVTEGLDGKELTGTVTVKACTHAYQYAHTTGTTTHSQTCPACGDAKASEKCDFSNGPCPCGAVLAVTLPADLNLTYNGTAQEPGVTVTVDGTPLTEGYSVAYYNNISAGNAAAVTVTGTSFTGTATLNFSICKATPTITWSSTSQELTYTGQQAVITAPTVTLVNNESFGGTIHYSYTGTTSGTGLPTNAGTYTIMASITAEGNYTNAQTATPLTLTINKAQAIVTGEPTANTLTYTGASQALVTAGTASVGEVVYSLTETGTYSTTIPTGTNAGGYTVWYKIADTDNYNGTAPVKVDVTISKVNYTGEKAGSTSGKFGMTKTYDLKNLLPEGYVLGTITTTDTNNIFEGTPTVSGTVLTYKLVNDGQKVNSTGKITVPVTESTNYNLFNLEITVTVANVRIPDLNVNSISVVYTGNPVNSNQITGTATVDGNTVLGTWSFAGGQALTNVADSGPKSVVFSPANTGEYGPATGTVTVTITRATPSLSLTPSPATLPNGGMVTLTLSGLPSGGAATVTCSDENITVTKGSGDTWTAELSAGGASCTFTATYAGDGNHNGVTANCTVSIEKITPTLSLTAAPASPLTGGGTVTLTLSGLPAGGTATVTCDRGITVTAGAGNTWTAALPNRTAAYTFTASYAGNASYNAASASRTVETTEVTILPNPPEAEDGKQYQVIMEDGISEVPAGLQSIETLNTPEKLETAMKTAITQANSGVPQANTAVYDVELQISADGGATWTKATAANFPANGLTVTLPYPAGTNNRCTFTVVHMFTTSDFGKTPGNTETPRVTNTASGLRFTVTGLSPISVGWVQPGSSGGGSGSSGGGGGGGGWSPSTCAVTVEKSEHGKVTSNRTNAGSGSTVTLTVTPDTGYVLDTLTVTDSRGSEIRLTAQGGGKYTFTMPGRAVAVKATFAPLPDDTEKPCDGGANCPSHGFTDLGAVGTWYHEAVDYVLRNNLMGGHGNGMFSPNDPLTRAQSAQILYNKEGRPAVTGGGIFTDVAPGVWCAPATTWAAERGIVGGYGNGMFGPNDNISREQLAVMLWRYAGSPAATGKKLHFNDADKASGYALDALRWAVENGIINGKGGGILDPKGPATRAQTAQMLKNFMENR